MLMKERLAASQIPPKVRLVCVCVCVHDHKGMAALGLGAQQ